HFVHVANGHFRGPVRVRALAGVKNEALCNGPALSLLQHSCLSLPGFLQHLRFSQVENRSSRESNSHQSNNRDGPPRVVKVPEGECTVKEVWTDDFVRYCP